MDTQHLSNQILTLDDLVLEEIISQLNGEDIISLCVSNNLVADRVLSHIRSRPNLTRTFTGRLNIKSQSLSRGLNQHQVSKNDLVSSFLDKYERNGSRSLYILKNGRTLKKSWTFQLNEVQDGDTLQIIAKLRAGPNQNYGDLLEINDWTRIVNAKLQFGLPILPLDRM